MGGSRAAALAAGLLLVFAAGADAATVWAPQSSRDGFDGRFDGTYNENDDLTITVDNGVPRFHDPPAKIDTVDPCYLLAGDAYCPQQRKGSGTLGVLHPVTLDLNQIIVRLGTGNDHLHPLSGVEWVQAYGGPGDDVIDVRGMGSAYVEGGPGADTMLADSAWPMVSYSNAGDGGVNVSLNGIADDGAPGEGDDVIGFQSIEGSPGPDRLVGSDGDDRLVGGRGSDGADRLFGGPGSDGLETGPGDVSDGGPGDDWITDNANPGGPGAKTLIGGEGNDRFTLTHGGGTVDAGPGDDTIDAWTYYAVAPRTISCGDGDDTVHANPADQVAADCEHVTIDANPGGPADY